MPDTAPSTKVSLKKEIKGFEKREDSIPFFTEQSAPQVKGRPRIATRVHLSEETRTGIGIGICATIISTLYPVLLTGTVQGADVLYGFKVSPTMMLLLSFALTVGFSVGMAHLLRSVHILTFGIAYSGFLFVIFGFRIGVFNWTI